MANNYCQYSIAVSIHNRAERAWLLSHTSIDPEELEEKELEKFCALFELTKSDVLDWGWPPGTVDIDEHADEAYFYEEEGANLDIVASFISTFLREHNRKDVVLLQWADSCSKPRTDEFGGGAIAISADGYEIESTSFLAQLVKERLRNRQA